MVFDPLFEPNRHRSHSINYLTRPAFAHDGHLVFAHQAGTVGEVVAWREFPLKIPVHTKGSVFGMVVAVVENEVEDAALKSFFDFGFELAE